MFGLVLKKSCDMDAIYLCVGLSILYSAHSTKDQIRSGV